MLLAQPRPDELVRGNLLNREGGVKLSKEENVVSLCLNIQTFLTSTFYGPRPKIIPLNIEHNHYFYLFCIVVQQKMSAVGVRNEG